MAYNKLILVRFPQNSMWTGSLKISFRVFKLATLTSSSLPLIVCMTRPRGHWLGPCHPHEEQQRRDIPRWFVPFGIRLLRPEMPDQVWHKCQGRRSERVWYEKNGSDSRGLPMWKYPGVKASIPSSLQDSATSGRLFKHASIWVIAVKHSSKVSFTLVVTRVRWRSLRRLSTDLQSGGECSGMNFHWIR